MSESITWRERTPIIPQELAPDAWLAEMARLAGYVDAEHLTADTGEECWGDYYLGGYSPASAWAEECSYD